MLQVRFEVDAIPRIDPACMDADSHAQSSSAMQSKFHIFHIHLSSPCPYDQGTWRIATWLL